MRVFISYSHKDKDFTKFLIRALNRYAIDIWLDEHRIGIGDQLLETIESGISDVDFVIVVISPDSITSQWVQDELDLVLQRENVAKKKILLPLLLRNVAVPNIIAGRRIADFRTNETMERDFRNLLRVLGVDVPFDYLDETICPWCATVNFQRINNDGGSWCRVCGKSVPPAKLKPEDFEDIEDDCGILTGNYTMTESGPACDTCRFHYCFTRLKKHV